MSDVIQTTISPIRFPVGRQWSQRTRGTCVHNIQIQRRVKDSNNG
jgi:hypothetical protein